MQLTTAVMPTSRWAVGDQIGLLGHNKSVIELPITVYLLEEDDETLSINFWF